MGSEYVLVEVTPPSGANVDEGLWIDTSNDEITVGFDSFHNHFDDWTGESSPFGTQSALEFVQQIVAERVAIMTCWRDDRCVGGEVMNAGETIEPPTSTRHLRPHSRALVEWNVEPRPRRLIPYRGRAQACIRRLLLPVPRRHARATFGLYLHDNEGTEGTENGVTAITTGLGWVKAAEYVVVSGKPSKADLESCWELGATIAAQLMEG